VLWGRTFLSSSVTEQGQQKELLGGTHIQLTFIADRHLISANAGCNEMSGLVSVDDGQLVVGDVAMTAMGCEPFALHNTQDEWVARFLTSRPRWTLNGTRLALDNGSIRMLLDDREIADPDRPLRGTRWVVDGVIEGGNTWSTPAIGEAYITFGDDGRVIGSTGCNSINGGSVIDEATSTITFSQVQGSSSKCDDQRKRVEDALRTVLSGRASFEIRANTLQLAGADGHGLTLRSDAPAPSAAPRQSPASNAETGSATTPSRTPGALPLGAPPQVEYLLDGRLVRGTGGGMQTLPDGAGDFQQISSAGGHTVVLTRDARSLYVVAPDNSGKRLVHTTQPILGIAVDASRIAYAVQVVEGAKVTSNLVLVDIDSGAVLQRLNGAPNARPVAFSGSQVVLSVGDGGEASTGSWLLADNKYREWPQSAGDVPIDAVGNVALVAEGDYSCTAVFDLEPFSQRFSTCAAGRPGDADDRFRFLSPDGRKYAGTRSIFEKPNEAWPVVADAETGTVEDRFRSVFTAAGLTVKALGDENPVVWEDATHILAVAISAAGEHLVVRCDVNAATCESALNFGATEVPLQITLVQPTA
jgi:heat shock protein HslJ